MLTHSVWSLYPTTGAVLIARDALLAGGGFGDADSGDDWVAGVSLARHSAAVRARLRADPATPTWLRAALPAVAVLQWVAIHVLRPASRAARRPVSPS